MKFIIPVIIRATEIIIKGLKYVETVPGKHSVDSAHLY